MAETLRPVAIVGGARIPFARSNTAYVEASNQDMLTAALDGLVARFGLQDQRLGEVSKRDGEAGYINPQNKQRSWFEDRDIRGRNVGRTADAHIERVAHIRDRLAGNIGRRLKCFTRAVLHLRAGICDVLQCLIDVFDAV